MAGIVPGLYRHPFKKHSVDRRAETLPADQLLLALETAEQGKAEKTPAAEAKSPTLKTESARKRRTNRCALPSQLPQVEKTIDFDSKACPCCGGALYRIGEEVSKSSTSFPRSSTCSLCADLNIRVALAKMWSSERHAGEDDRARVAKRRS